MLKKKVVFLFFGKNGFRIENKSYFCTNVKNIGAIMKKRISLLAFATACLLGLHAQEAQPSRGYTLPEGKEIYIPEELRDNDFTSPDAQWSYYRMACTPNVVCFWEKGFGDDLSKAPDLDGHPMTVDLDNLLSRVEYFYNVYRDMMGFLLPGSKAERYRMMVMLNYSLEGMAYGGCYDDVIGALWIAPNRIQDKTLNCIAHELGHSFQTQIALDGHGGGGGAIMETSAQWMLWQVNPRWTTDENYHWEAYKKDIHLSLFHFKNMYHAPFVLEYWGYRHGLTYMADMFRGGRRGEDFAQTYMRMYDVSVEQMGDELLDCYSRLITFDFPDKRKESVRYACELLSEMRDTLSGWKTPVNVPETYGFNVDEITLPAVGKTVKVQFRGLSQQENIGYRYGLVAVDNDNNPTYLGANAAPKKTLTFTNPGNMKKLYLVVVGCPTREYKPVTFGWGRGDDDEKDDEGPATYPYMIKF
jgi:hypothetical protein